MLCPHSTTCNWDLIDPSAWDNDIIHSKWQREPFFYAQLSCTITTNESGFQSPRKQRTCCEAVLFCFCLMRTKSLNWHGDLGHKEFECSSTSWVLRKDSQKIWCLLEYISFHQVRICKWSRIEVWLLRLSSQKNFMQVVEIGKSQHPSWHRGSFLEYELYIL